MSIKVALHKQAGIGDIVYWRGQRGPPPSVWSRKKEKVKMVIVRTKKKNIAVLMAHISVFPIMAGVIICDSQNKSPRHPHFWAHCP